LGASRPRRSGRRRSRMVRRVCPEAAVNATDESATSTCEVGIERDGGEEGTRATRSGRAVPTARAESSREGARRRKRRAPNARPRRFPNRSKAPDAPSEDVTCPLRAGSRSPHAARAARRGARGRGDRGASSWNPHIPFRDSDPPFESATRPVPSRVFPVSSVVGRDAEPRAREHASRGPRAPHATDGPRGARIQGGGALRDVRAREDVPRRARRRQDRGVARARPRRRRVPQAGAVRCDAVRAIPGRGGARLHAPQRRDGVASRQEHVHHVRLPRPAPPRRARLPAVQVRVRVDGTVQHRLPGHFRPLLVRAAGSAPPLRTPT